MRRTAPGIAAVVTTLLLGTTVLTGCGNDAGAAATTESPGTPAPGASLPTPSTPPDGAAQKSSLAGLAVVPPGYVTTHGSDPRELTGPFGSKSYLSNLSAVPHEDKALFLNAGFTEGYQAYRTSKDGRKRFTVQLFKTASKAKAKGLLQGFWGQENRRNPFSVPGVPEASSDARVVVTGIANQAEAIAEVSFVVGSLVAEISVHETAPIGTTLKPDTALVASMAKLQKASLTGKSG